MWILCDVGEIVSDSFSLLICFKKRLAMIQLQHDYTKNPKLYSLPKDMELNPMPSKHEKDANKRTHRGKLHLGLTQRSFISSEAGKDRCFERVERQQGSTIRRPKQKASMTYSRSPRKIHYRTHLKYFSDNRSYMEQPSVVIFSKTAEVGSTIVEDKRMFTEETPNQLHSQTSKLTRDILSYSSDVVMAKSNTRKHSIYNKAKQSNSPSSHSNVSSPLFQISASVIKESGVNGMDIVWDEVEERKTTKEQSILSIFLYLFFTCPFSSTLLL